MHYDLMMTPKGVIIATIEDAWDPPPPFEDFCLVPRLRNFSLPQNRGVIRGGSTRLVQKYGTARPSGRFRRTDPPALETDPPSTTNAYSGAAIWRLFGFVLFGLVWFGLVWFGLV